MRLDDKFSASVGVVLGAFQGYVLEPLLFVLYTSELFHIVGSHIVSNADDITIYAIVHRPLSRPQVTDSINPDLAAINFLCLKWHMRLNPKMTKSIVASRSCTTAPGYSDLN